MNDDTKQQHIVPLETVIPSSFPADHEITGQMCDDVTQPVIQIFDTLTEDEKWELAIRTLEWLVHTTSCLKCLRGYHEDPFDVEAILLYEGSVSPDGADQGSELERLLYALRVTSYEEDDFVPFRRLKTVRKSMDISVSDLDGFLGKTDSRLISIKNDYSSYTVEFCFSNNTVVRKHIQDFIPCEWDVHTFECWLSTSDVEDDPLVLNRSNPEIFFSSDSHSYDRFSVDAFFEKKINSSPPWLAERAEIVSRVFENDDSLETVSETKIQTLCDSFLENGEPEARINGCHFFLQKSQATEDGEQKGRWAAHSIRLWGDNLSISEKIGIFRAIGKFYDLEKLDEMTSDPNIKTIIKSAKINKSEPRPDETGLILGLIPLVVLFESIHDYCDIISALMTRQVKESDTNRLKEFALAWKQIGAEYANDHIIGFDIETREPFLEEFEFIAKTGYSIHDNTVRGYLEWAVFEASLACNVGIDSSEHDLNVFHWLGNAFHHFYESDNKDDFDSLYSRIFDELSLDVTTGLDDYGKPKTNPEYAISYLGLGSVMHYYSAGANSVSKAAKGMKLAEDFFDKAFDIDPEQTEKDIMARRYLDTLFDGNDDDDDEDAVSASVLYRETVKECLIDINDAFNLFEISLNHDVKAESFFNILLKIGELDAAWLRINDPVVIDAYKRIISALNDTVLPEGVDGSSPSYINLNLDKLDAHIKHVSSFYKEIPPNWVYQWNDEIKWEFEFQKIKQDSQKIIKEAMQADWVINGMAILTEYGGPIENSVINTLFESYSEKYDTFLKIMESGKKYFYPAADEIRALKNSLFRPCTGRVGNIVDSLSTHRVSPETRQFRKWFSAAEANSVFKWVKEGFKPGRVSLHYHYLAGLASATIHEFMNKKDGYELTESRPNESQVPTLTIKKGEESGIFILHVIHHRETAYRFRKDGDVQHALPSYGKDGEEGNPDVKGALLFSYREYRDGSIMIRFDNVIGKKQLRSKIETSYNRDVFEFSFDEVFKTTGIEDKAPIPGVYEDNPSDPLPDLLFNDGRFVFLQHPLFEEPNPIITFINKSLGESFKSLSSTFDDNIRKLCHSISADDYHEAQNDVSIAAGSGNPPDIRFTIVSRVPYVNHKDKILEFDIVQNIFDDNLMNFLNYCTDRNGRWFEIEITEHSNTIIQEGIIDYPGNFTIKPVNDSSWIFILLRDKSEDMTSTESTENDLWLIIRP